MDGYLDNQLMLLGWLSHGMAMPVADTDEDGVKKVYMDGYLDNQLMLLGWLSHGMAMPVADTDGDGVKKVYVDGYLDNQLMLLGWLSHRMAMPLADADGPFIISEITNKLVFGWTIMSSSFQDFAYCGTRELIFSIPGMG
ncbi:hypothetical protein CASFOL_022543 [Castilleja foliolosa]|uniref:Uncharacterized protein n=1 Tax=Castilleja foliolosa TaxID=1961234 RepID=A0ABD3CWT2_9LAMI